jgi:hypothetical protein
VIGAEDKRHRVEKKDGRFFLVWHGNEFISGDAGMHRVAKERPSGSMVSRFSRVQQIEPYIKADSTGMISGTGQMKTAVIILRG